MNYTHEIDGVSLTLSTPCIDQIARPGPADDAVEDVSRLPSVAHQINAWEPVKVRAILREYGAWSEDELRNHRRNCLRLLWIMAWDMKEGRNN